MKVTTFGIALGMTMLLTPCLASATETPLPRDTPSAAWEGCSKANIQAAYGLLWHASTNARHANVSRVRYTAAHAMPSARGMPLETAATACSRRAEINTGTLD